MRLVYIVCGLLSLAAAREDDWQPIVPDASITYHTHPKIESPKFKIKRRPSFTPYVSKRPLHPAEGSGAGGSDTCSIYKISMNQELFYQYVEYMKDIPDLKEFTLCMWTKFHNHSSDHPLFSYSVEDRPKEIAAWISNVNDASYFSMAVHGQTFFRLNYPLKLNTWYHSCQSWNGKTGEWQIWVNAERVGRGFHNRLVGHVIKGGGTAITGQDQSLLYQKDDSKTFAKTSGLIGEVTMVQLYHVALTAGKAHKDHKHHHAHQFKHDGSPADGTREPVTEPPPEPSPTPIGNGNFLIAGQIQKAPVLNLAGPQPQPQPQQPQMIPIQLPNGIQFQQEFVNGQLGSKLVSEQLLSSAPQSPLVSASSPIGLSNTYQTSRQPLGTAKGTSVVLSSSLLNPANVQYIDDSVPHTLFKRGSTRRDKRDNPEKDLAKESGKKDKRELVLLSDGSVVDQTLLNPSITDDLENDEVFQQSLMNGLAGVVGNIPVQNAQKESDEREPAEAEVKAVMMVCSGCAPEPFKKALVLSWRLTPKKLFSGAHYYKGLPICRAF